MSQANYIDACMHYSDVLVVERDANGKRRVNKHKGPFNFYVEDPAGTFTTIHGTKARMESFAKRRDMRDARDDYKDRGIRVFESDVKPEYKLLERLYAGVEMPRLQTGFIDIEVDVDGKRGWARWENPWASITAITIHRDWIGDTITLALRPPHHTMEEAAALIADVPDCLIFESEFEMLEAFLELLDDCDVITGWNSEKFDLPYIVARIRIVLGGEDPEDFVNDKDEKDSDIPGTSAMYLRRLSPVSMVPRRIELEDFGSTAVGWSIPGRPHLDYLDLYKKFVLDPRDSYKLDNILWVEIKQRKVKFEGTLEQLYRTDWRTYILYNRQDVDGLVGVDRVRRLISIANKMAHDSCVFLSDAMGSVSKIEQAILLKLHSMGMVAGDKPFVQADGPVAGALVFDTVPGLHPWLCTFDVKSLYPSVIRMLNISPEVLIGQFETPKTEARMRNLVRGGISQTEAWQHFVGVDEFNDILEKNEFSDLTLVLEDGSRITKSAIQWHAEFSKGGMALSANGTVFDLSREGIIPLWLTEKFNQRKEEQGKYKAAFKRYIKFIEGMPIKDGALPPGMHEVEDHNQIKRILMDEQNKECKRLKEDYEYWDLAQGVTKVALNSAYGALLNIAFRFGDPRMGQSTTLSGRVVTKHIAKETTRQITGKYEHGSVIIAGDTDSCMFTLANEFSPDARLDAVVERANAICSIVNGTIPAKMSECFFVPESRNTIIINREIVGTRGLFKDGKKRYAIAIADKENTRVSEMKIMGMDTKRTEIPEVIRKFLQEILEDIVRDGRDSDYVRSKIEDFSQKFDSFKPWELGKLSSVSSVETGSVMRRRYERGEIGNPRLHYTVVAADNTNRYIDFYGDRSIDYVRDGDKIAIFKLRKDPATNPLEHESIALTLGTNFVPEWFKRLPFAEEAIKEQILFQKLEVTLGVLGWPLRPRETAADDVFG